MLAPVVDVTPVEVLFGEYLPDLPEYKNPGSPIAKNVIPAAVGYTPLKALANVTDALNGRALGAIACRDKDSNVFNYIGSAAKIEEQNSDSWDDVTNTGGAYTTASGEFWEFAKWGEQVIATNFSDNPQAITFGGTNFADLSGSPPKARHIAIVKDFVVLGNLNESGTIKTNKVRWSGINDETQWAASAAKLSDAQELNSSAPYGGGWIMKIVGGEYGLVFREYTIHRMTFLPGDPAVFGFDEIGEGIGTPCRNGVVRIGERVYFVGQDGFYVIYNGSEIMRIGANRVDQTFLADVNTTRLDNVIGAADPVNGIVMWIYPSGESSTPDKAIIYDWVNKKWSFAEFDSQWLYSGLGVGQTVETLDDINTSIDALTASLDSREYTGGSLFLAGVDSSNQKATFTGTPLEAILETQAAQLFKGKRAYVDGIGPLVEGTSPTITVDLYYKNKLDEAWNNTGFVSVESETNICPFANDAKFHKAQVKITGTWEHALGIDAYSQPSGFR